MLLNPGLRFLLNGGSAFLRNCPGDPASVLEMLICRIDNRIDFFDCDIALHDLQRLTGLKVMFNQNRVHKKYFTPLKRSVRVFPGTAPQGKCAKHPDRTNSNPTNCYFVFAITAANVCGSRIAISDNILRLRVMFAFFNAATSLL